MSDEQAPKIPDNAPWWSKAIEVVLHTGGVSLLLILFWMGQKAGWIPDPTYDELQEIKGHIIKSTILNQRIAEEMEKQSQQRQLWCVKKATTNDEKEACFPKVKGDH